ncbi:hypothetical protein [Romboutsia sp. 1001713B170207_170306_H8]|uniref:hypothetical protein n=1 Tax=Romboutsia sp. 1001713B170207_170306_H8 TaxID=2787112 RepID=UPI001898E22C|nr:hypothetical protein [Romboutsia sp. 1001713B170207_170306_H8]
MSRKLSKREKILIIIFVIVYIYGCVNLIQNNKKNNIQIELESLDKKANTINKINDNYEKDIILKIENEIKNIVNINYINKNSYSDENNNYKYIIEIQVSGRIDNIFYIEGGLKNIGLENKISKFEIIKNTSNLNDENEIIKDYVNCIIQIKGI